MDTRTIFKTPPSHTRAAALLLIALSGVALPTSFANAQQPRAAASVPSDGQHDFDFVIGRWKAHLRKLLNPLTGSATWVDYDGTSVITKIWDEHANMEELDVSTTDPLAGDRWRIQGQTLRLYDPASHQWNLYLLDAAKGRLLLPATVGSFENGRGEFFDAEDLDGRTILVRYVWTHAMPASAHLEQSFSPDWGKTWEVNWVLDLTPGTR